MEYIYDFHLTDPRDAESRLQVNLEDFLEPLSEFSICFWFLVTHFKPFNSLLSYALSDEDDNTFKLVPSPSSLSGMYQGRDIVIVHQITPLRWYHTCFITNESSFTIHFENSTKSIQGHFRPLMINGSLVIGQEQDSLDGGYTTQQSFAGRFTNLNVWRNSLEADDLIQLRSCSRIKKLRILKWDSLRWNIHNDTGAIKAYEGNPCAERNMFLYLLFDNKEQWTSVLEFTKRYQLQMIVPKDDGEREYISKILNLHQSCTSEFTSGVFVWLGIKFNSNESDFEDFNGESIQYDYWHKHLNRSMMSASIIGSTDPNNVMQESKGEWYVDDNMAHLCYVAERKSNDMIFYIHNLKDFQEVEYDYDSMFIMAPWVKDGSAFFNGLGKYNIRKLDDFRWCIIKYNDLNDSALLCVQTDAPPIGRFDWTSNSNGTTYTAQLALSTCESDQYTCPSGECISLRGRCNQQMDCKNGADEMNCFTTTLPEGYVLQLPSEAPLYVVVTVNIWRIGSVAILNMAMSMDLVIDIQWLDSRLQFRHLHENVSRMITRENEKIWSPELIVSNSILETRSSSKDIFVRKRTDEEGKPGEYLSASGSLIQTEALQVTFHCDFELAKYPLDDQFCDLKFQITNVGKSGLIFSFESNVETFPKTLSQYVVRDCKMNMENLSSSFSVSIALHRRPDFMIWSTFIPTLLLLGIGYGTLFLPADSVAERGGMSLTNLLVLISLYSETSASLPITTYMKFIDIWFVFCIAYLSLIITIHLASSNVQQPNESDRMAIKVFPSGMYVNPSIAVTHLEGKKKFILSDDRKLFYARIVCLGILIVFVFYISTIAILY